MKTLSLSESHTRLGARFGEFAGWRMPLWYSGAVAEHRAVRAAAGVFDISHMGRFRAEGPEVGAALSSVFSRDYTGLTAGASMYSLACNESGGIIDDLIVYRPDADRFYVICNAANHDQIGAILAAVLGPKLHDLTDEGVLLAVQGPQAVERVASIVAAELNDVPRRGCRELSVGGADYFCSRTGYTGEDGFEIMTSVQAGGALLDRLMSEGACVPCGLAARDSLRLEAALPLHGVDIDETTLPWEAGLGWAVDLEHDFTGRDALAAAREGTATRLTCIVSDGAGILRSHQDVFHQGSAVAQLSSGGYSPSLDASIGLAYLPRRLARENTPLEVEIRGQRVPCHTVKRPFYRGSAMS